jgi:hypothetical protein
VVVYVLLLWAFPEPSSAYVSGQPRVSRHSKTDQRRSSVAA